MSTFQLDFDFRYSFSEQPLLYLTLTHPERLELRLEQAGYLDSGSTYTSLPAAVASQLGISVQGGKVTEVNAAGRRLMGFLRPLRLEHDDLGPFHLEEAFVHLEGPPRVILGQDVMDHLTVAFRFDERQIFLKRHR